MNPETWLRAAVTAACGVCVIGLAGSLDVSPGWLWTGGAFVTGALCIWLWRRWLERVDLDREARRFQAEMPVRPQETIPDPDRDAY